MEKPIIAITMGDAAGIGPEITAKCLAEPALRACCEPLVLGDLGVMQDAAKAAGLDVRFTPVTAPESWSV